MNYGYNTYGINSRRGRGGNNRWSGERGMMRPSYDYNGHGPDYNEMQPNHKPQKKRLTPEQKAEKNQAKHQAHWVNDVAKHRVSGTDFFNYIKKHLFASSPIDLSNIFDKPTRTAADEFMEKEIHIPDKIHK